MYYSKINKLDVSNGSGIRVSLFVSGCRNFCEGCFNKEAWDFKYGQELRIDTIEEIINELDKYYINGFSLLGGEPFDPLNQECVLELLYEIKQHLREDQDIWIWTGYNLFDDLLNINGKAHTQYTEHIIEYSNYIVDGRFDKNLYDYRLKFRGSSNQHIYNIIHNNNNPSIKDVSDKFVKF